MEKLLVVDDMKSILDLLSVVFQKEGYQVKTSTSAAKVFELIEKEDFDLVISDIRMPEVNGMDLLKYLREHRPDIPVVMITAYGSLKQAVEALKMGAVDYIVKPFDVEELKITVAQALETRKLKQENIILKRDLRQKYGFENMIGKSLPMQEIYGLVEKVAPTESTILITGESGTGKEMVARAVHYLSRRSEFSFISINCAALPENLLESELFGHARGSFTGAVAEKKGMFEVAQKGTLFLDEIGETTPWTQVKLLRALQERKIRRVGGTDEIPIDVRIIAATNLDLKKRIQEGLFREELFYRLNVISLEMPPLRKRTEDISLLVSHFLQKYCQQMGKKMKRITPEVLGFLETYRWPGNVRELENAIERIVAIEERETITPASLPPEIVTPRKKDDPQVFFEPEFNLMDHVDEISKKYINAALLATGGNLKRTAAVLGISYRSLRYLLEKYEIRSGRDQESGRVPSA
jgi:DNA-binding NtrC family response regulator